MMRCNSLSKLNIGNQCRILAVYKNNDVKYCEYFDNDVIPDLSKLLSHTFKFESVDIINNLTYYNFKSVNDDFLKPSLTENSIIVFLDKKDDLVWNDKTKLWRVNDVS